MMSKEPCLDATAQHDTPPGGGRDAFDVLLDGSPSARQQSVQAANMDVDNALTSRLRTANRRRRYTNVAKYSAAALVIGGAAVASLVLPMWFISHEPVFWRDLQPSQWPSAVLNGTVTCEPPVAIEVNASLFYRVSGCSNGTLSEFSSDAGAIRRATGVLVPDLPTDGALFAVLAFTIGILLLEVFLCAIVHLAVTDGQLLVHPTLGRLRPAGRPFKFIYGIGTPLFSLVTCVMSYLQWRMLMGRYNDTGDPTLETLGFERNALLVNVAPVTLVVSACALFGAAMAAAVLTRKSPRPRGYDKALAARAVTAMAVEKDVTKAAVPEARTLQMPANPHGSAKHQRTGNEWSASKIAYVTFTVLVSLLGLTGCCFPWAMRPEEGVYQWIGEFTTGCSGMVRVQPGGVLSVVDLGGPGCSKLSASTKEQLADFTEQNRLLLHDLSITSFGNALAPYLTIDASGLEGLFIAMVIFSVLFFCTEFFVALTTSVGRTSVTGFFRGGWSLLFYVVHGIITAALVMSVGVFLLMVRSATSADGIELRPDCRWVIYSGALLFPAVVLRLVQIGYVNGVRRNVVNAAIRRRMHQGTMGGSEFQTLRDGDSVNANVNAKGAVNAANSTTKASSSGALSDADYFAACYWADQCYDLRKGSRKPHVKHPWTAVDCAREALLLAPAYESELWDDLYDAMSQSETVTIGDRAFDRVAVARESIKFGGGASRFNNLGDAILVAGEESIALDDSTRITPAECFLVAFNSHTDSESNAWIFAAGDATSLALAMQREGYTEVTVPQANQTFSVVDLLQRAGEKAQTGSTFLALSAHVENDKPLRRELLYRAVEISPSWAPAWRRLADEMDATQVAVLEWPFSYQFNNGLCRERAATL